MTAVVTAVVVLMKTTVIQPIIIANGETEVGAEKDIFFPLYQDMQNLKKRLDMYSFT